MVISQSKNTVIETIESTEKSYELVSSHFNPIMTECLELFNEEYEKNKEDLSKIDMKALKERYQNLLDLYIIDHNGVITHSTFPSALGIDFKMFPDFYENLTSIREGNETVIDIADSFKKNNPFIKDLVVYDFHIFKLGYAEEEKDQEKIKLINEVFKNKQNYKIINSNGFIDKEYIYVNTFSNVLDDSQKVIEITYTYDSVLEELSNVRTNTITFILIYALISLLVVYILTSKYITNPLIKFTNEIKNISSENLQINLEVESNNEIGLLKKNFNSMSEKLQNTLISKKYLENVIDSIGDILIILDKDFNIFRINRYTLNVLGKTENELLGMPLNILFEDSISESELIHRLKDSQTIENIENTLTKADNTKTVVLSSFSVIYGDDNQILGYICNAKDITSTKLALRKLEESNLKLIQKEAALRKKYAKDCLTGIYNREYIMKALTETIENTPGVYSTFSVIMFDLDYFKNVNDQYGHQAGDDVLRGVANIIRNNLRTTDYAGRYGGEEFIIILPDTSMQEGLKIAEK